MLNYIIIVKFDLNNVPKICHFNSIKESFMSFSSIKNTCYIAKKMLLGIHLICFFKIQNFPLEVVFNIMTALKLKG
jgi:hypothetical protein